MESTKNGVWYPELVAKDLVDAGLSAKSLGVDILDQAGKRFFYNKVPFALVAWKPKEYMMLAFAPEMPDEHVMEIAKAFTRIVEYRPFVKYETYQRGEYFKMVEWSSSPHDKLISLMSLPGCRNIEKIADKFIELPKGESTNVNK